MSSELLMLEQEPGAADAAPWILDRHGQQLPGRDDSRRTLELRGGLARHTRVRTGEVHATQEEADRIVQRLHDRDYITALRELECTAPTLLPQWAPPGLPADSPVWPEVVSSAFAGVRTAVAAARTVAMGARFSYALCRPPGHHAGPGWMGGYCYLNTAAAAAQALRDAGVESVAILDLDFHFPTGTSAVVARMPGVSLHSLHASTLENVPWREVPERKDERFWSFNGTPEPEEYLAALESSLQELRNTVGALVLSLGYDTVGGDPHGSWSFPPEIFAHIGSCVAASGLAVCVVQEGGYALELLAACSNAFARGLLASKS